MASPVEAVLSLGSNVGDPLETLTAAVFALHDTDGIAVEEVSGVYETAPWGGVEQDPFLNCCVRVRTTLPPHDLLAELQRTEAAFGRDRSREERWGPRTLDLDVVLYGDVVLDTPDLVLPHPRAHERPFVLVPLLEVLPGATFPDGRRVSRMLAELAPIEGIDLVVRLSEVPGAPPARPEGPGSPRAVLADEWTPPARRVLEDEAGR
jgi:2-amino-4-hydroxy-6-hydroxymethyldihydropteridine diphosphokinase